MSRALSALTTRITPAGVSGFLAGLLPLLPGAARADLPVGYQGTFFADSVYQAGPQVVPGRIQAAYYDLGGEGVAYHDVDRANHGSGELNYAQNCPDQASQYVCHFREKDGTDPSYTKTCCDFTAKNFDVPERKQFYIGWQANGEWLNYTVRVTAKGRHKIKAMYANGASTIRFDLNNQPAAVCKFPVTTGSPHDWKYADSIGVISFPDTGLFLLTYRIAELNNTAYFDFAALDAPVGLRPARRAEPEPGPGLSARALAQGNLQVTLELPSAGEARLSLLDAAGSVVRAWPARSLPAGPQVLDLEVAGAARAGLFLQVEHAGVATVKAVAAPTGR